MHPTYYQRGRAADWQGRVDDAKDIRLHQQIVLANLDENWSHRGAIAILGFCSEEGVRRNKGRVGAADGPQELRSALSNSAWHFSDDLKIVDAGNVHCQDGNLEEAQLVLAEGVASIIGSSAFPIVLGGGHETAWGSYMGIRQIMGSKAKIGIVNIDAHFDLRTPNPQANSGTPFWQMADWAKNNGANFSYICLGINPTANTQSLFEMAEKNGVDYVTTDDLSLPPINSLPEQLTRFVQNHDHIYLSIDLDAFDAAFAPGVSAPASLGLSPYQVLPWLRYIAASGKMLLCDICELNPAYDLDRRTAKLGASLLYRILQNLVFVSPF